MTEYILDKMTSYVNEHNVNDNNDKEKEIVKMIRDNLVKRRQLNAKIYAHNMAVRAQKQKKTVVAPIPKIIEAPIPKIIERPLPQANTTIRRKQGVVMDKCVITNNIIF